MEHAGVHWHIQDLKVVVVDGHFVDLTNDLICHWGHYLEKPHDSLLPQEEVTVDRVLVISLRKPIFVYVAVVVADVNDELIIFRVELFPSKRKAHAVLVTVGDLLHIFVHFVSTLELAFVELKALITGRSKSLIQLIKDGLKHGISLLIRAQN